jgi:hypothetical protein
MAELPNTLTHVGADELGRALADGWRKLFGVAPRRESILTLMAQSALETGRWRYCHCWSLGNIKSVDGDGRDFTFYRCSEIVRGKEVWFDPPSPTCRFRAFHTLAEGAVDYLAFLRGLKRYQAAWADVLAGDPLAFVHSLKAGGYFTAAEAPYARSVSSLFHEFTALPFQVGGDERPIDGETRERVMALVTLSLREIALQETERPPPSGRGIA